MMNYAHIEDGKVINVIIADEQWVSAQPDPNTFIPYTEDAPAVVGGQYIDGHFTAVQPWPSWVLNTETYKWDPPTPFPDEPGEYYWNELSLTWAKVERP
jgi:hypothetical protein